MRAGPKYESLGMNPVGEVCMATPALSDGMIVLRTMKNVLGIAEVPAR